MTRFLSLLDHQDVLTILTIENFSFAGIGGSIYVYNECEYVTSKRVFERHKIHLLKSSNRKVIYAVGGKNLALCTFDGQKVNIISTFKASDWILDVIEHRTTEILLLTSHNQVYFYDFTKEKVVAVKSTDEKCILYSGIFHRIGNKIFILAGTVFSETLVWRLNDVAQPVIALRIKGHKGVIFSISVKACSNNAFTICTTSDDRTANVVSACSAPRLETLSTLLTLHGHHGRVWKSLLTENNIFTIGEDSLLCAWSYDGLLTKKCDFQVCGGIRSISMRSSSDALLIGGCDGSIISLPSNELLSSPQSVRISHDFGSVVPRKVAYLGDTIVCLTDESLFHLSVSSESISKRNAQKIALSYSCTDLAASKCEKYIALSTACGHVLIYSKENAQNVQLFDVGGGKRTECVRWFNSSLLVQIVGGIIKLFEEATEGFVLISSFNLPKTKERALTCFLRLNALTLVGDRAGNLHVFGDKETPQQSINKLHSLHGLLDIALKNDVIVTVGTGGKVRELAFLEGSLCLLRTSSIPMETASKVIHTSKGLIIAGFQGSYFQLWNLENRYLLASLICGGGHRSFDIQLKYNHFHFIYIKNKQLYEAKFPEGGGRVVRKSYHSKVINCMGIINDLENPILVSGSDDNTVRVVELAKYDITLISIIEQHISSVRALRIFPISAQKKIIISAGGREQISITEFDLATRSCRELLSHFTSSLLADCRFMCLEVWSMSEKLVIFVGSSDSSIRIFQFDGSLEVIGVLKYTHCILQVLCVEHFLISFGTDGKGVFWDLKDFLTNNGPLPSEPCAIFTLHQSGINSAVIRKQSDRNTFLLATGGDDNTITLSLFEFCCSIWRMISSKKILDSHSCQITGLMYHNDLLISTGVDQRLILHKIEEVTEASVETTIVGETVVAVPDAHGLAIIASSASSLSLCVFGKGIEVIKVELEKTQV